MPWILNEDAALKVHLQGLTVSDANASPAGRSVTVRYRSPKDEFSELKFPLILIEHLNMSRDTDREHRGHIQLPYAPEGLDAWYLKTDTEFDPLQSPYYMDFPIPYNIDYQISLYTRDVLHQLPLVAQLAQVDRIPERFGYLEVPQDGTTRSTYLLGGPEFDYAQDADGKIVFRVTYVLRVATELTSEIDELIRVKQINLDTSVYFNGDDITIYPGISSTTSTLSTDFGIKWNTISSH